ncbi:MerR family transcriptional regulator [Martelella mangrovi]|uniref:DNA-binding transcriptional MerR regulator n=1 Tax=Martelella mangrovi TaxID=1397477 RepID=A0ABV2I6N2_9HYPH
MFSIGELSRRTGVKVPTIRYYEQNGLIAPAERSEGNQRRYGSDDESRLTFIRHARDLGIRVDAIRELLELSSHPEKPCDRADAIARDHLAQVCGKIAQLKRLEAELARITSHCEGHAVGECYVIRSLADHGLCSREHV